jgi:glutamate N-acetyltransferase/amino-acid N-acetyltransferase
MAALGRSDIAMKEAAVDIWIDQVKIVEKGLGKGKEAEAQAAKIMREKDEFSLIVDLHEGPSEGTLMTCDLTPEYIAINADYRT